MGEKLEALWLVEPYITPSARWRGTTRRPARKVFRSRAAARAYAADRRLKSKNYGYKCSRVTWGPEQ